jgi:mannose-6-phosphate isomerase-like protein (cupin superfamily)
MITNIHEAFDTITLYWSPKIIAEINDVYVKLAKLKGEFVWHDHADEDEYFQIIKGELEIKYENYSIFLKEGDSHVVPKGKSHFPIAKEECWVLLIENKSTAHTGDIIVEGTKSIEEQLK